MVRRLIVSPVSNKFYTNCRTLTPHSTAALGGKPRVLFLEPQSRPIHIREEFPGVASEQLSVGSELLELLHIHDRDYEIEIVVTEGNARQEELVSGIWRRVEHAKGLHRVRYMAHPTMHDTSNGTWGTEQ